MPAPRSAKPLSAAPSLSRAKPALKLRMRVMTGDTIAVGPGKVQLLEAMAQTGSITAAARALGMSYRRAWLLIDELNRALKAPAVASSTGGQHGGGSQLTDTGRELIARYRGIEAQAQQACQDDIKKLLKLLA